MKYTLFLLAIALFSCRSKTPKTPQAHNTLSSKIDSLLEQQAFNGVILIQDDSTVIYSKEMGFSDLENKVKITLNDQFVIGSISKQITAVLTLRGYEQGRLKLEDTISQYLTTIQQPWAKEVTIHQLLTHTHGIIALDQDLAFKAGSQFQYSQLGYDLLAQILQKTQEKTFEELSSELFEQFGLTNTFHPQNKSYKKLVNGYEANEKGVFHLAQNSLQNYPAAGSFISNASDLVKWNQLLFSGKLINAQSLNLMQKNYAVRPHPIFGPVNYGYGLLFKDGDKDQQIGALGYAPGFVAACYYYPQKNINLVVLENTAKDLNDFTNTFIVHTLLMQLCRE